MLRELYVRYVIIGHSERRQYFHEDNATVNRKTKAALAAELRPIVCIGETLPEREADQWKKVLETQLLEGLAGFAEKELADIIIAYEPVWAIGTGKTASPAQAEEAHQCIRKVLGTSTSATAAAEKRPHPVRRQRQARERQGAPLQARHRRRARRRGQPRRPRLHRHHQKCLRRVAGRAMLDAPYVLDESRH